MHHAGHLVAGQETTTNTYVGHVFFFTLHSDRSVEVARFLMHDSQVQKHTLSLFSDEFISLFAILTFPPSLTLPSIYPSPSPTSPFSLPLHPSTHYSLSLPLSR